jgi:hypothetical protein
MAVVSGDLYRKGATCNLLNPLWVKALSNLSIRKKIPIEYVNEKYVGVLMDTDQFAAAVL